MRENDSKPIEAIEFKSIQDQNVTNIKREHKLVIAKPFLWFAFPILIACGISVFFFLPDIVEKQQKPIPATVELPKLEHMPSEIPEIEVLEISTLSPEEIAALKIEAEKLLAQVIKKQESLQQKGVKRWAEKEYLMAVSLGDSGDEQFRKKNYQDAILSYQNTISALDGIESQVEPTLEKHLKKGELALQQGEQETAIFNFEIAKAIDDKNLQAINGLKRAETIYELFEILEKGGNLEAAGRLADAKKVYEEAFSLDPLSTVAKSAIDRVDMRLKETEFSRLIALGYTSLDAREYEDARNAFETAQTLFPKSDQPKKGLNKINQTIRQEKIASLTVEANYFEEKEEWGYASKSYQQILELSPNSKPASDGLARNQQRTQILTKLDSYIEEKERLNAMQVRAEAHMLLEEIALLEAPGSKIENGANTLEELIKRASIPVTIKLLSDNQTNVVIYKVGKFGQFENKDVTLKLGKYTIVGSRPGYRDVRAVLNVSADMKKNTIAVICKDPI